LYVTMKYRCSECSFVFPCREAIDAYDEGIKRGFLCPSCKSNIQELFFRGGSKRLTFESEGHEKWFKKSTIGLSLLAFLIILLQPNHWIVFVLLLCVVMIHFAYCKKRFGFVPYPNVIGTERIED
ncbi:hypothetical protein, partial [Alteromonas flava]|uniref:hypothetical protein n=1 Tax=Alteromonas flava TaxID=2048003 RepID=UPI00196AB5CD